MTSTDPLEQTSSNLNSESFTSIDNLIDLLRDLERVEDNEKEVPAENPQTKEVLRHGDREIAKKEAEFSLQSEIEAMIATNDVAEDSARDNNNSEYLDVDVDIKPQPTLLEAVEYETFLRQTIKSNTATTKTNPLAKKQKNNSDRFFSEPQQFIELEATVDRDELQIKDLADSLNNLIPLIVELLKNKTHISPEAILEIVTPALDRIIERRSQEDNLKMSRAIAKILPSAISEEIQLSPQAIAKAIAPEIAIAIEEQIRLDKDAISNALGSEMGKAIKTQIEVEKDAMVDALYPVIGDTISKYMVEVVQSINDRVENALSIEGIKRKFRAKMQGVSEAELIFQESVKYRVQAVFLIDKDSGLIIQEVQSNQEEHLESDMVGGMLTAIRSFANDCIASGSELDEIDYGNWQIPIEVAGYCYLAAIVKGEPSQHFRKQLRNTLSKIVMKYGNAIKAFQGDADTIPSGVQLLLQNLTISEQEPKKSRSSPTALLGIVAIALGLVFIPWGIFNYRNSVAENIVEETAVELDANPELSVYRIDSSVKRGKLILTGRVPDPYFRNKAIAIGQKIAEKHELELDERIVAIDIPPEPEATKSEIARLTAVFNRQPQIAIATDYQSPTLNIKGFVLQERDIQLIQTTFQRIPGVNNSIVSVERQLPTPETRIYFPSGKSKLNLATDSSKIEAIKEFIARYPQLHWQIIGHSDRQGASSLNQQLGLDRAKSVRAALIALGVDSSKLKVSYSQEPPPEIDSEGSLLLSRCVRLKSFIPTNSK